MSNEALNLPLEETKQETEVKQCKTCGEVKTRYMSGKYAKLNKKWTNDKGQLWNGKVCPECNVKRLREHMRLKNGIAPERFHKD